MSHKVVFDTDIGDNVDDALALAYLLARPDCELLGVTTVGGNDERRVSLAREVCAAYGRPNVPVCAGLPTRPRDDDLLDDSACCPPTSSAHSSAATLFQQHTIREHRGQVTLLATGPLTNVASLFLLDRSIVRHLDRLVLMGGSFGVNPLVEQTESNVLGDSRSASVVYDARVWPHQSVGLDVTRPTRSSAGTIRMMLDAAGPPLLIRMVEEWLERHDSVTFNDPLAAACLFDPMLCRFERGRVTIETEGPLEGRTTWTKSASGPHEVAVDADAGRFLAHFAATLQGFAGNVLDS